MDSSKNRCSLFDNLKSLGKLPSDVNHIVEKYCNISRGHLMHSYELISIKNTSGITSLSFDNFIYAHCSVRNKCAEIFTCGQLSATISVDYFHDLHVCDGKVFVFYGCPPQLSIYTPNGIKIGELQLKIHHNKFNAIIFKKPCVQNNTFCIHMVHGETSTFQKYNANGSIISSFHVQNTGLVGCCYDVNLNTFILHQGHIKQYSLTGDFIQKIRIESKFAIGIRDLFIIDKKLCYSRMSDSDDYLEFRNTDYKSNTLLWQVKVDGYEFSNFSGSVTEYKDGSHPVISYFY